MNRNDKCSCGSGKKYKKCCIPKQGTLTGASASAVIKAFDDILSMMDKTPTPQDHYIKMSHEAYEGYSNHIKKEERTKKIKKLGL